MQTLLINDLISGLLRLPKDERELEIRLLHLATILHDRRLWNHVHGQPHGQPDTESLNDVVRSCPRLVAEIERLAMEGYPDRGRNLTPEGLDLLGRITFPGDELARLDVATGAYERLYQPRPGDVVVDGGAHVGFLAERLAILVGHNGIVLAFEPEPRNFFKLTERTSKYPQVHQVAMALHDRIGEAMLALDPRASVMHALGGPGPAIEVKTFPIDSFEMPRLDFLKLDVEGSEYRALEGARKTVERCRPAIVVEVIQETSASCEAFLREFGYTLYGAGKLTEDPSPRIPYGTGILWGVP